MSKGWMALMKTERKKNKGFTMIELITAIAILGVLSVTVIVMMNSSSKTYSSLSVESQLQSEAQLVANAITELAIDSFDAVDELPADFIGAEGDNFKGRALVLESTVEIPKKQYLVIPDEEEKALYLVQRVYDSGSESWTYNETNDRELLANYISGFSVDTSRVEDENMLEFTIAYMKNDRTYEGNYQVLMRNRAFADKETEEEEEEQPSDRLIIGLDPQIVYVDVVNGTVPRYYKSSVADSNVVTMVDAGVEFTATVKPDSEDSSVNWELRNEDDNIFSMSSEEAEKSNLTWDMSGDKMKNSAVDMFTLVITKEKELSNGATIAASPKMAQILLRRIKRLDLYALSGTMAWSDRFADVFEGESDPDAEGYAYKDKNGQYLPIYVNASISSSNIAYGGGLTWSLYKKTDGGDWNECQNSSFAKLSADKTETSTSNVVTLGSAAENGDVYKVVATSIFDPSFSAEYIFGVAPSGPKSDAGFYSRGYYTDMEAVLEKGMAGWHGKQAAVSKLVFLKVTKVDGSDKVAASGDKISIRKDPDGTWRLYIDYDAFAYSGDQKKDFYGGNLNIHITIGYYDEYGHLCIDGEGRDIYQAELEAQEGRKVCTGDYHHPECSGEDECICDCMKERSGKAKGENEAGMLCKGSTDLTYKPLPVEVTKIKPEDSIIVLEKGKTMGVSVQTHYYNIVSPRKGNYYFGAYIDDMYNNLLEAGKASTHAYFDVEMASDYGDTDVYVDKALVQFSAKNAKEQKKYLSKPMKLRLAANDFYLINTASPDSRSYTDYEVLLANVNGASCYIPGPEAELASVNSEHIVWSADEKTSIEAETETTVTGLSTNGAVVTAKIRKEGTKYYCDYNGKTYLYKPAYDCWD